MDDLKAKLYKKVSKVSTSIKIVGTPEEIETHANGHGSDGELDEVNANEYETFTLEEIRSLILAYRQKNKDFLLARVTTPDPENGDLFYNFYYSTAEINRVLFRFESSRRLLHRMKVKNPLNNMFIVGQVLYYKITTLEVDSAIVDYYYNTKSQAEYLKPAYSEKYLSDSGEIQNYTISHSATVIENPTRPFTQIDELMKSDAALPEIEERKKLIYEARYFATDDDFLVNSGIRDYFRQNALDENDEFLYEMDRTHNDFMALLEDVSDEEDEDVSDWRRIFSAHISLALSLFIVCILIGGGPILAVVLLPIGLLILASFLLSLLYILCCRRSTFDTLAVESMSENTV